MDSLNQSTLTPNKTRLSRAFAKVLHIQKLKSNEKLKQDHKPNTDEKKKKKKKKIQHCVNVNPTMDAFIAKVFATVSSVKAAYAQLQVAQSPYDPAGIQLADQVIVSELKRLSEFKQLLLKKHLEDDINDPETTILLADIQEQKNLLPMYQITARKLDSKNKLKDSEIIFLKEKLNETNQENKMIERRLKLKLNSSGNLSDHEKFNFSYRTINSFLISLQQTTRSIKSFVKLMMCEMEDAKWDLYAAARSIHPDVVLWDTSHSCFAFEAFVCRVMFDGFNNQGFDSNSHSRSPQFFFDGFMELKSLKAIEYISWKPNSMFAKFCRLKYLKVVHPKMESSLFGNLIQRNLVSEGKFPETNFFALFADVARRVWLLHCLAFAFDSDKPSVFQVRKGIRFTEVFMESVNEGEAASNSSLEVGFTVVPGFKVGGTVVQCQVYLI
ncbi:hypothetical protein QVD17_05471 [Tagetes erecta]|uniref:DUF641 domain-containing protein n=1 Tax=Tagetes erecta TaxID=13708 RepID=A0AAD8PBI0_TARER|nr:hypothetical protein QVD17_05471 [Tagetes erecta]